MESDRWATIGEVAEVFDGPHATPQKIEEGPYFLSISSLEKGKLDLSKSARISEEQFVKWTKRVTPQKGDVLFSYETRLGEAALMPDGIRACLGRRMGLLRPDTTKVDPRYLLFSYLGPNLQMEIRKRTMSGATVDRIALKELPNFPIKIPPLAEQKAIAHVLGTLDDRIELNQRMNETLEGMAQALFKSWFVDFDPVIDNALASGKEIPDELSARAEARAALGDRRKPLPEEIRKLFPDEFRYSEEMGWIPEGWEVKSVEEAIDVNPRVPLKKGAIAKFVDMKALPTSGFSVTEVMENAYSGGAKFINGDVLLARITPCIENGKTGVVDFLGDNEVGFGSTEFIVLRGKGAIQTPFIACLSRYGTFRNHCIQSMVGTSGRQRVQNACFSYFYLTLPKDERILNCFHKMTAEGFRKFLQTREQSSILRDLRDTLLPKLLSGELRIPDAEKLIESNETPWNRTQNDLPNAEDGA